MPPVVGYVAAAAYAAMGGITAGASIATAFAIANVVVGTALSFGISKVASLIAGKPNTPSYSMTGLGGTRVLISRSSVESRKVIYGQVRTSGPLVFVDTTDNITSGDPDYEKNNQYLHMVIPLAGHEVEEIGQIYIDERPVDLDEDGFVTNSRYIKNDVPMLRIRKHLGSDDQTVDTRLRSAVDKWTDAHRLRGIAYLYVRFKYDRSIFPSGAPQISALVKGKKLYDPRDGETRYSDNWALVCRDYITNTDYGMRAKLEALRIEVNDDTFISGANICDEDVELTNSREKTFTAASIDAATDEIAIQSHWFFDADTVQFTTTGSLPTNLSLATDFYARNAGQHAITIHTTREGARTNTDRVNLTGNGSGKHTITRVGQARYTINGVVDTAIKKSDNLKSLWSGVGTTPFFQGSFKCYPGAYQTPTVTIDESWLSGNMKVEPRPPRSDLFNAVKGIYIAPNKHWQPTDFRVVKNATYETQDGEERIPREVEFPYVLNQERAQRYAKIILEKGRQGIVVQMPCKYFAAQLSLWDTVYVNNTLMGWSSKVFRVIQWSFDGTTPIMLTLQEESAASYDWNAGEATVDDDAPDTNLPDPGFVYPAGNPVVTEELYQSTNGSGVKTQALLTWADSTDHAVNQYILEYKLSSDTMWIPAGTTTGTNATIADLAPGIYDFGVTAVNWKGVQSERAQTSAEIYGLTTPPAQLTGFSLNAIHNNAHLQWNQSTDLDVKVGGTIRLKWSAKTTGATWTDAIDLGPSLPGIATNAVVPLLDGTYFIKAVDSSGHESETATEIVSTVANLLALNVVATSTQHGAFSGTKTNMAVVSSKLRLDNLGYFDDATGNFDSGSGDFDDAGSGGFELTGTYLFDNEVDLGDVYTSRVTANIDSTTYDTTTTFDETAGDFDDRSGMFDGEDLAGMTVDLFIRTTSDDPAGVPVWSNWRKFVIGDYTARAFEFKLEVTSTNSSYNVDIAELSVTVDVPERDDEKFLAEAIGTGGNTLTYNKPFFTKPFVGVTLSSTSGDTVKIAHITSGGMYTAATVQILNAGAGVARTCDIYVKGY